MGVVGGFVGERTNTAIMRTMDVFYAFPSVLLAVAIAGAMGGGIANGMLALTLVFVPPMCRVAETATTQIRALDFIEAARASGARTTTIIRYHVLGNVLGPVFIYASSLISVSILLASGLSFLGLGVRPPVPDWGLMLSTLRQSIYVVPFVCALPGFAIFHHLDLLQSRQRRIAGGDGRTDVAGDLAHPRSARPRRPAPADADRPRFAQAFPGEGQRRKVGPGGGRRFVYCRQRRDPRRGRRVRAAANPRSPA